jgi:hypothetical protein
VFGVRTRPNKKAGRGEIPRVFASLKEGERKRERKNYSGIYVSISRQGVLLKNVI